MKYFLDTEFIEDGKTIDLISIGIAAEDGREYYAVSSEFNPSKASEWVWKNVLEPMGIGSPDGWYPSKFRLGRTTANPDMLPPAKRGHYLAQRNRQQIKEDLMIFLLGGDVEPTTDQHLNSEDYREAEIWGYYADYDWVAFCQLFGTMMDLPKGLPMYCRDIKQWCDELGNPNLPEQGKGEHHALYDARWNKKSWEFLQSISR